MGCGKSRNAIDKTREGLFIQPKIISFARYVDTEFTPEQKSLGNKNILDSKRIEWHRCSEIFKEGVTLYNSITPFHPTQGELGDCYFINALSALAIYPQIIQSIFKETEINPRGIYSAKMYINGVTVFVLIDDYIPCKINSMTPLFAQPYEKQIWVMLLEKAWAKAFCSYSNIIQNDPGVPISMFTGAPYCNVRHADYVNNELCLWELIQSGESYGPLAFPYRDNHSCFVVSAKSFKINKQRCRILKIRDPQGDIANKKCIWSKYDIQWSDKAKKKMNYTEPANGIFYMSFEDYISYFSATTISYLHSNYKPKFGVFGHKKGQYSVCKFKFYRKVRGYIYASYLEYLVRDSGIGKFDNFVVYGGLWKVKSKGEYEYIKKIQIKAPCIHIMDNEELEGEYLFLFECTSNGPKSTNQLIIWCYTEANECQMSELNYPLPVDVIKKLMKAVSLSKYVVPSYIEENPSITTYFNLNGISICSYMVVNNSDKAIIMQVSIINGDVSIPDSICVLEMNSFAIRVLPMSEDIVIFHKNDHQDINIEIDYIFE